jgi:hypothetical protein
MKPAAAVLLIVLGACALVTAEQRGEFKNFDSYRRIHSETFLYYVIQ